MKRSPETLLAWISGEMFATGALLFSMGLVKAFLFGLVGGFGGLVAKIIYEKYKNKWG